MGERLYQRELLLLHLSRYDIYEAEGFVYAPREITQDGIAEKLGIGRNNVPRLTRRLLHEGLIEEKKARVKGAKNLRKVYLLTPLGRSYVAKLKKKFLE